MWCGRQAQVSVHNQHNTMHKQQPALEEETKLIREAVTLPVYENWTWLTSMTSFFSNTLQYTMLPNNSGG